MDTNDFPTISFFSPGEGNPISSVSPVLPEDKVSGHLFISIISIVSSIISIISNSTVHTCRQWMMSHLSKDILGDAGVGAGVGGEHRGDQVHVGVPWRGCCLGINLKIVIFSDVF